MLGQLKDPGNHYGLANLEIKKTMWKLRWWPLLACKNNEQDTMSCLWGKNDVNLCFSDIFLLMHWAKVALKDTGSFSCSQSNRQEHCLTPPSKSIPHQSLFTWYFCGHYSYKLSPSILKINLQVWCALFVHVLLSLHLFTPSHSSYFWCVPF